jgi:hypothetical protein
MSVTFIPEHRFESVSLPSFEITFDRLTNQFSPLFSPQEIRDYLFLYEKAQKDPKGAQKEVENLFNKKNHLPEVYNLLSYIYVRLKKIKKVEKLIEENYTHNPNNLFAKINYADQCLRKGKVNCIPEILQEMEDLHKLYPSRTTFHYSEVVGYYTLLGFYHLKLGNKTKARDYCTFVKIISPEDSALLHLSQKISQKGILSHFLDSFKISKLFNKKIS